MVSWNLGVQESGGLGWTGLYPFGMAGPEAGSTGAWASSMGMWDGSEVRPRPGLPYSRVVSGPRAGFVGAGPCASPSLE